MNQKTTFPFLLFLSFFFISCEKFEVIPGIPPEEPEPPKELIKFDKTYNVSDLNCSDNPYITDVVEVPDEGYVIIGNCSRNSGMVMEIDTNGVLTCNQAGFTVKDNTNIFFGMARNSTTGEILAVGYADDMTLDAGSMNMVLGNNCSSANLDFYESTINNVRPPDSWDAGNNTIFDPFDNHFIVAGKWEAFPTLFKFKTSNVGTSGIADQLTLDTTFFDNLGVDIVPPVPVPGEFYATPSHDLLNVMKTEDNAYLAVGWVDVIDPDDNSKSIRKALLLKTKQNSFEVDWIEFYSKAEFPTIFTRRNSRGFDVIELDNEYVLTGDSFDQEIPKTDPNNISGDDLNGFILHVSKSNGSAVAYTELYSGGTDLGEDKINGIVKKHGNENKYIVTGKHTTSALSQQGLIREYYLDEVNIVKGDIQIDNIGDAGKKSNGEAIIATSDGGYLVIVNTKDGNSHFDVKAIKMDAAGRFN